LVHPKRVWAHKRNVWLIIVISKQKEPSSKMIYEISESILKKNFSYWFKNILDCYNFNLYFSPNDLKDWTCIFWGQKCIFGWMIQAKSIAFIRRWRITWLTSRWTSFGSNRRISELTFASLKTHSESQTALSNLQVWLSKSTFEHFCKLLL